jgi:putative SOS response-associated peptidase YedK
MCHAYSITTNVEAIRQFVRSVFAFEVGASVGNMPPQTGIYPAMLAPIIRHEEGMRVLDKVWWGMPSPSGAIRKNAKIRADRLIQKHRQSMSPDEYEELIAAEPDPGVHNVRNTESAHWKRWLAPQYRVVVPFNSFAEWSNLPGPDGKKQGNTWFAFTDERPLGFFAGIMAPQWTSIRRIGKEALTTDLFAFLTTEPNAEVAGVQESMPVILTTPEDIETWMTAPWDEARQLQRPLPNGTLTIVSVGNKEDPPEPEPEVVELHPRLF